MKKETSSIGTMKRGIIIGLIIGLIIGGVGGYIANGRMNIGVMPSRGSFQISEDARKAVTSFFDSNPDVDATSVYCGQNMMNCVYYCRTINPQNEMCKNLQAPNGTNWRGNFQGGRP